MTERQQLHLTCAAVNTIHSEGCQQIDTSRSWCTVHTLLNPASISATNVSRCSQDHHHSKPVSLAHLQRARGPSIHRKKNTRLRYRAMGAGVARDVCHWIRTRLNWCGLAPMPTYSRWRQTTRYGITGTLFTVQRLCMSILNSELTLQRHINKVASVCFYHIRHLKQICQPLGPLLSLRSCCRSSKVYYCTVIACAKRSGETSLPGSDLVTTSAMLCEICFGCPYNILHTSSAC